MQSVCSAQPMRVNPGSQQITDCPSSKPATKISRWRCVHKIVMDPENSDTLYMQFHGGVFKTTNSGDSWQAIESGLPGNFGFPMAVTRKGELFVAPLVDNEGRVMKDGKLRIYRSTNAGSSWNALENGFPEPQYVGVLNATPSADALDPGGVYFGTSMGEVFASNNAGDLATAAGQFPTCGSGQSGSDLKQILNQTRHR